MDELLRNKFPTLGNTLNFSNVTKTRVKKAYIITHPSILHILILLYRRLDLTLAWQWMYVLQDDSSYP